MVEALDSGIPVTAGFSAAISSRRQPVERDSRYEYARRLLVDSRLGVVKRVVTMSPDPGDVDLYLSYAELSNYGIFTKTHGTRGGAGIARARYSAERSAFLEAVERYSLVSLGERELVEGTFEEVRCIGGALPQEQLVSYQPCGAKAA